MFRIFFLVLVVIMSCRSRTARTLATETKVTHFENADRYRLSQLFEFYYANKVSHTIAFLVSDDASIRESARAFFGKIPQLEQTTDTDFATMRSANPGLVKNIVMEEGVLGFIYYGPRTKGSFGTLLLRKAPGAEQSAAIISDIVIAPTPSIKKQAK